MRSSSRNIESRFVKILVLSQYWYPENGVPQRRWTWLTEILVDAGHEVLVIAPPPHYERKIPIKQWVMQLGFRSGKVALNGTSGEKIMRSGFFPASNSLTQRVLNQASVASSMALMNINPFSLARRFKPDLVIGTVPALPTSILTQIVARLHRTPYMIDLRDAWPDLLEESRNWNEAIGRKTLRERVLSYGPLQLMTSITGCAMNSALRGADGVVTTSESLERHLSDSLAKNFTAHRPDFTTVRNVFPIQSTIVRGTRKSNIDNELHVLYAGTLGRAQKLDNALRAVKITQGHGLNIKLKMVGGGATWHTLKSEAKSLGLDVEFLPRDQADALAEVYAWADTALVHLTDWEPLKRAIPSKTYELMELGIHISGVVDGEAAYLIKALGAGHVVSPEDPESLAELWMNLARDRELLDVASDGREWVQQQREEVAPHNMLEIVDKVSKKSKR